MGVKQLSKSTLKTVQLNSDGGSKIQVTFPQVRVQFTMIQTNEALNS